MSKEPHGPTPGFLVWRLAMKWRVAVDRALAPLGLTHAQYALLSSLYGVQRTGAQPTQRELADHTGLEALYVSKLARALEADGLLERAKDPADSRAVRLSLTAGGRETTRRAIAVVQQLLDQLTAPLGGLTADRTEALVRDLTALLDAPLGTPGGAALHTALDAALETSVGTPVDAPPEPPEE
ncbi:MarR family winged helix-turn-helix transcriptional regulator [Streptomyces sp. NRRL B-24484]|uniref:MarR family winged helix-turn-helix transcriptional regulator n=1 Tax=Streptomyces sp. NRRL B-24484 TaxID=1463833 RepID=UPI0006948681|nr:MarR family transcriptional regulator [Streptomyces sp. NRRL B-24484]